MKIFLLFMIAFNCYMAGYNHGERNGLKIILTCLFIGLPWFIYEFIRAISTIVIEELDKWFKVEFWWHYYIKRDIGKYTSTIKILDKYYKEEISNKKGIKAYFWKKGYYIIKREANKK